MDPSCLVTTLQAGGGVMVWGMFSWHTLGPLVPIGHLLSATAYLNIVSDHIHPFISWWGIIPQVGDHTPLFIHSEEIEKVTSYRYLGIHLDTLLSWSDHVEHVCSRLHQRLYFLRRLRVFGVSQNIMYLFRQ